jgi:hypothetical protein
MSSLFPYVDHMLIKPGHVSVTQNHIIQGVYQHFTQEAQQNSRASPYWHLKKKLCDRNIQYGTIHHNQLNYTNCRLYQRILTIY